MKKSQITINELQKFESKYESLVWYARKPPQQIATIPGLKAAATEVECKYPDETAALRSADSGDWSHGFNSGMLAAVRLAHPNFSLIG